MKNSTFNFFILVRKQYLAVFVSACLLVLTTIPTLATAADNAITEISYSSLPGDQVQIKISLENSAAEPGSFTIDSPARIAFDFPNTKIKLSERSQNIGIGVARSISTVEAGGRTRVVLNLSRLVTYTAVADGNDIIITLGGSSTTAIAAKPASAASSVASTSHSANRRPTWPYRPGRPRIAPHCPTGGRARQPPPPSRVTARAPAAGRPCRW